jgi:sterol desaturase/sphingolipid hydroxylase (fatty acid hydroxylase superfamily)
MIYERLHCTFIGIVATIVDSIVVAEFAGYWLHRLLHSDRFPALSRPHLIHHFLKYGPQQPMRAAKYCNATDGRFSLHNIGMEWLAPSAIILSCCYGVMVLLSVPPVYVSIALCTLAGWPIFMFSYLHDKMHVKDFWMTKVPLLKGWFLNARRMHDIHHRSVDSRGMMDTNFGIGFYFVDRIFQTSAKRHRPFDWSGYRAAIQRYGFVEAEPLSPGGGPKPLFDKKCVMRGRGRLPD